jgi:osmotically-inducible protein OsmY
MKFHCLAASAVLGLIAFAGSALAQGPAGYVGNGRVESPTATVASSTMTAGSSDQATTKAIRASIAADKTLSADARKVKIVTTGGRVTLSGAVLSDDEKSAVGAKATAIAGSGNVVNQINVAPAKS